MSRVRISSRRGFTLVEIMFGLAIAAMVGGAVAAMLVSVSESTATYADLRGLNVKQTVVATRIDSALRSSMIVLGRDADALILWVGDTRRNGRPNLSELRRVQWDAEGQELWSYRAPPGLSEADDTLYALRDDFGSITWRLMGSNRFPGELWATGVTAWSVELDSEVETEASLVTYRLTVEKRDLKNTVGHAVSLRGR